MYKEGEYVRLVDSSNPFYDDMDEEPKKSKPDLVLNISIKIIPYFQKFDCFLKSF